MNSLDDKRGIANRQVLLDEGQEAEIERGRKEIAVELWLQHVQQVNWGGGERRGGGGEHMGGEGDSKAGGEAVKGAKFCPECGTKVS